jgi:hypothetical protein
VYFRHSGAPIVLTISNLISKKQNLITDLKQTEDFLSIKKLSIAMRSLLILTKACKWRKKLADCEEYCDKFKFPNDKNQREIEVMEIKISETERTSLESNISSKASI